MQKNKPVSRRNFLRHTSLALTSTVLAPAIIPAKALGRDGFMPPSSRINLGYIGLGAMARGILMGTALHRSDLRVVAVCDVDQQKLDNALDTIANVYELNQHDRDRCGHRDFRELLARRDVDGVIIATPDHWHALQVVAAAKAGKDIYCEKPISITVEEGQFMTKAVRQYGRVLQVGSQQRSDGTFRFACELARNGRLGEIKTVIVSLPGSPLAPHEGYLPPEPTPDYLDWDMWLGPAPYRPYNSTFAPPITWRGWPHWRYYRDYSGGFQTDFGAHHYDIAQWGLGTDDTGPVEIIPPDGKSVHHLTYRYKNGPEMVRKHGRPGAAVEFVGTEGSVAVNRSNYLHCEPGTLAWSHFGPNDLRLYRSRDHFSNWLECMRTRSEPICPVEVGSRSADICHIGNIAEWVGRPLKYDPENKKFVDDEEANRLLARPMRSPWRLEV